MAFDMQKLMQDPMMITALNMMAQSGFQPGANAGSRLGAAGLNSMRQLQAIESASADRTWRENQSEIQEERNKIAQEMQQKRFELQQKQFAEAQRANQAAEATAEWVPANEETGAPGYFSGPGGPKIPPSGDIMDMLLLNAFGGGMGPIAPGAGVSAGGDEDLRNQLKNKTWGAGSSGQAGGPGGAAPQVRARNLSPIDIDRTLPPVDMPPPVPVSPRAGTAPFATLGRNALDYLNPINMGPVGPLTPEQKMRLERMQFLGGAY